MKARHERNKALVARARSSHTSFMKKKVWFYETVLVREVPPWNVPKQKLWISGRDIVTAREAYVHLRRAHKLAPRKPCLDDEMGWCAIRHGDDPAKRAEYEHLDLIPYYCNTSPAHAPESKPLAVAKNKNSSPNHILRGRDPFSQHAKKQHFSFPYGPFKPTPRPPPKQTCQTCHSNQCRCLPRSVVATTIKGWKCRTCSVTVVETEKLCPICNVENNAPNSPPLKNLPVPTYRWV